MQSRPDQCILFSPFRGRFKKSDLFPMAKQPLRVLVPVSWVRSSSSKLLKFPTSILRWLNKGIIKYLVLLEATIQAILTAKYTVMFLLRHLGFMLTTTQKIEFLGLFIESVELNLSLTPQKLEKSQSSLQRNVISTSSISFGTDKIDRTFIFNSTDSALGKNTVTATSSIALSNKLKFRL